MYKSVLLLTVICCMFVAKISLAIPWTSLYSMPVVVDVEDVYILAGPITDRKYDARKEKSLSLAIKRNKLAELENSKFDDDGEDNLINSGTVFGRFWEICLVSV